MKRYTTAALVADSLSLGPHWIYNQAKLERVYPDGITEPQPPLSSYHPRRGAGQLTHYGDQTLWLSRLIDKNGGFDPERWKSVWMENMGSYDGYIDGASRDTMAAGGSKPSTSNDLAGATRIAPLLDLAMSLDETIAAARQQTRLTHGDPGVADAAEFFVRATFAVRDGASLEQALLTAAGEGTYDDLNPTAAIERASNSDPVDYRKASSELGLTCHLPEAFPLTLYFALRPGAEFAGAMSDNGMAGGDTSARAMLLALLFAARDGDVGAPLSDRLRLSQDSPLPEIVPGSNRVSLAGPGGTLAGVLEMPEGTPVAFALFAHCFTCGKDFVPEARITRNLALRGIATLRIDFSGIGKSEGAFAETSFLTNLEDLEVAAAWLARNFAPPSLLVGHSLGGTAALAGAARIESVRAVATIGAPWEPGHVLHLFDQHLDQIRREGEAEVKLAGRPFRVGRRFLDDLEKHDHPEALGGLRGIDVLVMHSPVDNVVSIDNAGEIFQALKHPKSFVSLGDADHLLTREKDTAFVAEVIAAWASRAVG